MTFRTPFSDATATTVTERARLARAFWVLMDAGFTSGERCIFADELAFLLGCNFDFDNDDGSSTYINPRSSWLARYGGRNTDIHRIIEDAPPISALPFEGGIE